MDQKRQITSIILMLAVSVIFMSYMNRQQTEYRKEKQAWDERQAALAAENAPPII